MNGLKDALKSAFRVWVIGTMMLWIPGLLGWVNEVTKWADQKGAQPFPDPSNIAFLFVAALTAAFPAVGMGILRYFENLSGHSVLRPAGPPIVSNPRPEGGRIDPLYALVVVILGLLAVALAFALF